MTPEIETARLDLKAVQIEDATDIYNYVRNPNVLRYTTGTPPKAFAETEAFVQGLVDSPAGQYAWSIRIHNQANVIGVIEFGIHDQIVGSVDYALAEPQWGQGIMTEVVRAVLNWGFDAHPDLETITSAAMTANPASTRVQQKCGMKVDRVEFQKWAKFDEPVELAYCSISRTEWENQNQQM